SLTQAIGWISTVSACEPVVPNGGAITRQSAAFVPAAHVYPVGMTHISVAAEQEVHLSCTASFTGDPVAAYGFIGARRIAGDWSVALRELLMALAVALPGC